MNDYIFVVKVVKDDCKFYPVTENGDALSNDEGGVRREDDELRFQYHVKLDVRQDILKKTSIKKFEIQPF